MPPIARASRRPSTPTFALQKGSIVMSAITDAEQAEARQVLASMGVSAKSAGAAASVLAYIGEALAYAMLVTDSADRRWLRRAAALYQAWDALPSWSSHPTPAVPKIKTSKCVQCGGEITAAGLGWRHLDVVDALAGDHDARAEVRL